jgi:hypothetical protein
MSKDDDAGKVRFEMPRGLMEGLGAVVGVILCFYLLKTSWAFASGEYKVPERAALLSACNGALTAGGLIDRGGCHCMVQAAQADKLLPPQRQQTLQALFESEAVHPQLFRNVPPAPVDISRQLGLVIGHPWLTQYEVCAEKGIYSRHRAAGLRSTASEAETATAATSPES